jgi:hypothetical protein
LPGYFYLTFDRRPLLRYIGKVTVGMRGLH